MSLKSVDKEVAKALEEIGIELTQEMYDLYLKTGSIDFNRAEFLRLSTESTVAGMIEPSPIIIASLWVGGKNPISVLPSLRTKPFVN